MAGTHWRHIYYAHPLWSRGVFVRMCTRRGFNRNPIKLIPTHAHNANGAAQRTCSCVLQSHGLRAWCAARMCVRAPISRRRSRPPPPVNDHTHKHTHTHDMIARTSAHIFYTLVRRIFWAPPQHHQSDENPPYYWTDAFGPGEKCAAFIQPTRRAHTHTYLTIMLCFTRHSYVCVRALGNMCVCVCVGSCTSFSVRANCISKSDCAGAHILKL